MPLHFRPFTWLLVRKLLMALLGCYLRIDLLHFYQVIGNALAALSIQFVLYWCAQRFGLDRWAGAIGVLLGIVFLVAG